MITVASKLGSVIEEEMENEIGIMYDGWTHGTMHYVAVYGLYVVGDRLLRSLLAHSPLDGGSQDADAHIDFFRNVLAVYNKTVYMIVFMIADNCNIDRSIATKLGVPLVGCTSHRFNLAVKKFLTEHESLLQKVNNLMQQLRYPNNAAQLAKLTPLLAKTRNVTYWASTYEMQERYVNLRAHVRQIEAVEDSLPSTSEHKKLCALLVQLTKLDSVCKRLQSDTTSMGEVGAGEKLSAAETTALKRFEGQQSTQRPSETGR
ncbi:hypothetical protein F443_11966 [Phytophthora nicotianae P1569]|uniref:Uncharacterized protein n=2 Tax=Phytophthora nicotianae TaxID=4792 RepID=V9EWY0_PHYNI|nr:hypothetical protein F443_11966 [Phytophthora nicotianae P1569]